ncbi:Uncharacterised protein [[Clostridium] sordellii]|uniref:hypothetical protein n=1 Tax=Paraclostridium sordellii TaxID=1505 RepID=UPI0005DE2273|nr:hypothetical protein [Paeniclostridium sordellii]CEN23732.1 Uncharacterised protein [[Clostridium] sordellii] [Paeniclostridium sordellii]CEN25682.1 Uncharacterised protein [[Clostridium] sordellii] [Paeniclostridium sordellii]
MKIYSIAFLFILFIVVLPIFIYIKVRGLGLTRKKSIFITLSFPIIVPKTHINIFNDTKAKNRKKAFKILFMPITHLPMVITAYSKSAVCAEAKYMAIRELIPTLSRQELNKLEEILREEGLRIKVKNKRLKSITVIKPQEKSISNDISKKVMSNSLWSDIFSKEVCVSIRNEVSSQVCI